MCLPRTNSISLVIGASNIDFCHARLMDKELTEEDENCMFQEHNGTILLQATKRIIPGERLRE
jgi:hypothetical protein